MSRDPSPTLRRWLGGVLLGIAGLALVVPVLAVRRGGFSLGIDQWGLYVVGPLAVATGLIESSRRRPDLRFNLLLALATTGFSLLAAELVLTFTPRVGSGTVARPRDGEHADWDGRSPLNIVLDLRAAGDTVYPRLSSPLTQGIRIPIEGGGTIEPLAPSPAEVRVVFCNEIGTPVVYDSDEHGFNNPRGLWARPTVDVVLIGDSYTHGSCQPPNRHFVQAVRERVPSLLNLGVSGAGPITELAILREYAAAKAPRHVFWFYYEGNDRYDLMVENGDPVLSRYRDDPSFHQDLSDHQAAIDRAMAAWVDSVLLDPPVPRAAPLGRRLRQSLTLPVLRRIAGIGVPVPTRDPEALNFPDVFAVAAELVRSWGGTLHLVYLPQYTRYHTWLGSGTRGREVVVATAEALGVPVIDLVPVFDAQPAPRRLWTHPDGHYSPEGYRLVAEAVSRALGER